MLSIGTLKESWERFGTGDRGKNCHRILEEDPDPVVRFRLLRDVLRLKPDSDTLVRAHKETLKSRWVRELANEQKEDGSWGRFHSAVKCKGKIVTTKAAVERGLALGLEASDPIFQAAMNYLTHLLVGKVAFPDPPERNNRWATGTQLFAAATLARICPLCLFLTNRGGCGLRLRNAPSFQASMMRRRRFGRMRR